MVLRMNKKSEQSIRFFYELNFFEKNFFFEIPGDSKNLVVLLGKKLVLLCSKEQTFCDNWLLDIIKGSQSPQKAYWDEKKVDTKSTAIFEFF